jgi:hypothetical protein
MANEETRKRISQAQQGNKNSLGCKNALGYKHTEDARLRMSEAKKAYWKAKREAT